jgi:hypothetical protein
MIYSVKDEPGKEPSDWNVVPFVDVGAGEQYQARFLALADLFNAATTWDAVKKRAITDAFWSMVLEGFTPAFIHLRNAMVMSAQPNAPILNLRTEYNAFYSALWTAYHHKFADLAREMGYRINFLFSESEEKFASQSKQFGEQHSIGPDVIAQLGKDRIEWQNRLADIRNKVVQHAQIPADSVPAIYEPANANAYFDNCWQAAEWFISILLGKHLPNSLEIAALPDELTEQGKRMYVIQFKPQRPNSIP